MTKITAKPFGKTAEGTAVELFTFKNAAGCEVSVTNYGGIVVSIKVPDRNGELDDVVLGYDTLEGYLSGHGCFGAAVGRYANRIARGRFELNGKTYQLNCNDGKNHLHGGLIGFNSKVWDCEIKSGETGDSLVLRLTSPDGDEHFPGKLDVTMTYSFTDKNELILHYQAVSDADTICNLTNHSYFNLAGHDSGDILNHKVKIYADRFTEADSESIPTGKILDVAGTPMDFRDFHIVGERIDDAYGQLAQAGGYDHNWVLSKGNRKMGLCAEAFDEKSGRHLTCSTTAPCVQFYTGNSIGEEKGKGGHLYHSRDGLCFESQFAPDSINKPAFESPILKAGDLYDETTIYQFDVK